MHFFSGTRAVLDAARDNEHFAGAEGDDAVGELNVQRALEDEEEVVGVVMLVPDELALNFHDHDVEVIQLRDRARRPVVGECRQLGGEIDFVVHACAPDASMQHNEEWVCDWSNGELVS
jgi:hypothetical protein